MNKGKIIWKGSVYGVLIFFFVFFLSGCTGWGTPINEISPGVPSEIGSQPIPSAIASQKSLPILPERTEAEHQVVLPIVVVQKQLNKWSLWIGKTHLRGANIYQRRVYYELDGDEFMGSDDFGPPFTQEDFDHLAELGANYVNISHPGLFTEKAPYVLDVKAQENLDKLLEMAGKADLFAVITFRTGPGRSEFWAFYGEDTENDPENGWFSSDYYNNRVWGDEDAQKAWIAMWQYTADRYRSSHVVVGYDLMCEPNSNEVGTFPDGGALDIWEPDEFYQMYGDTLYDWNQFYPQIVTGIREVDPDTPIIIGGMAYSAMNWLPYMTIVDAQNVIYAVHQYEPFEFTHQEPPLVNTYPGEFDTNYDGELDSFNRNWIANLFVTVGDFMQAHEVPVAINEYGSVRWEPGTPEFMDDEMDIMEEQGLNYALWDWEPSWEPWAAEVDDFNIRFGIDPNNFENIEDNPLLHVIQTYWNKNEVRPSDYR